MIKPVINLKQARGALLTVAGFIACVAPASAASPENSEVTGGKPVVIAMHYVIPEFIGGQKVRTPEAPDAAMAQALAVMLGASGETALPADAQIGERLRRGEADVALLSLADDVATLPDDIVALPTGYRSRPMAIMRSDTDIKSWKQLRGRTVCVAKGGLYAGKVAAQYGAIEQVYRAPADSLLALRTGKCDAAVHDEALFRNLLKLPEWKKFSASLPPTANMDLVFAVRRDNTVVREAAQKLVRTWRSEGYLNKLLEQRANDIAFEVYLDQAVPDCH
ncbi:transporter substrate-binding domain-containing protein [Allopusillimonas ginsengisoli]|uniref:transporter substrate-binding domain-containing protein n=1 Tax=Allopusillimonas ginsengisoli TaxID=453575 RepID=UPI0010C18301|nr:transporter substrate-binding domain-containing protein [Allopusillimonas ginsengisoli]